MPRKTTFSIANPYSTAVPGRRRRRGYRVIIERIVREEKERARQELADLVYSMIFQRVFENEKRSDNNRPLPKHSASTLAYREYTSGETQKLVDSGQMRASLKVWATKQELKVANKAVARRGKNKLFRYADQLNTRHYGKRWVNLDIPKTFLPGGAERKKWIRRYRTRLKARFDTELYY
tara:strand:- start:6375 stop:6911 length:537 start_codon:yes stop_codon:yes gene_type:complete